MKFDPNRYHQLCNRIGAKSPSGDIDSIHDAYIEIHASGLEHFEARAFLRLKDQYRRRQRAAERFVPYDLSRLPNRLKGIAPESVVAMRDQFIALRRAIGVLSPDYRNVIQMKYFDDLMPGEIAELLGVPVKTVYTRLGRAIKRLRTMLFRKEEGGLAA